MSSLRKLIAVLICIALAASIFAGAAEAEAVRHVAAVPFSFFTRGDSLGEVIPGVDRFAAQINDAVFGRKTSIPEALASVSPAVNPTAGEREARAHPNTPIQGGFEETDAQVKPVFARPSG